jgi:hypothetical protein
MASSQRNFEEETDFMLAHYSDHTIQIMENWCWERDALNLFARHHETNEHIPEALFSSFRRARSFRVATK